jgi:hypothetical protein
MGVFFHILSTGGGAGGSRITRYIAERDKDLAREGPGSRQLFSPDQDDLTYRRADRILDPDQGHPHKDDLIHFSVMIEPEEFDKLGSDEKAKQARFREAVRDAMKGLAHELNVQGLTWVAGIHRNSQNPHAHIVMNKNVIERGTNRPRRIARIPKALLPHREVQNGKEVVVNGPIGDKFAAAVDKQQALYAESKDKQTELTPAERWDLLARKYQKETSGRSNAGSRAVRAGSSLDQRQVSASWNPNKEILEDHHADFRIALGKRLEFEMRLAFAEVWHERAVQHGDAYRFEVMDQSTGEERKISELDVHRRAVARASRVNHRDHRMRNDAIEADLTQHAETLYQLTEARETKIAALGKDVGSLRSNLAKVEQTISKRYEIPAEKKLSPLLSREGLSELQEQAVRLGLPDRVSELELVRLSLAREHNAPSRTDSEAATLVAQLNVARADVMARESRLESFDASIHLTTYEVAGDCWSLGAIDKQIARRREDAKLIPERATRLDLRSLARINYSAGGRERATADVEHLRNVRAEIVRQVEERRAPLLEDRELSREMLNILEKAYVGESHSRRQNDLPIPDPRYERYQVNALEGSAETLRDSNLLREVHELEKHSARTDSEMSWEGRAVAREIMSGLAADQAKQRLEQFLDSKKVASLHLGNFQTGTLREVEARSLTDYLARAILETREQRDHRHSVKSAARDHQGRLVDDFNNASAYHAAARELASEAKGREPQFNDKEKINLEIYAERQNDATERARYFDMARTESRAQARDVSIARGR